MQRLQREALQQTAQQVTQRDERCRAPLYDECNVRAASDKLQSKIAARKNPRINSRTPSSENPLRGRSHRCDEPWCLEASTFKGIGQALKEGHSLGFGTARGHPPEGVRGA